MPTTTKPTTPNARHRYKVFVSSTYLDNKERRQIVQDAVKTAGMVWYGMEILPASTRTTIDECLRFAKEADILVEMVWMMRLKPPPLPFEELLKKAPGKSKQMWARQRRGGSTGRHKRSRRPGSDRNIR